MILSVCAAVINQINYIKYFCIEDTVHTSSQNNALSKI